MSNTRPRDLTAEELAGLESGAVIAPQTSPLPVPPRTAVAVESIGTAAADTAPAAVPSNVPTEPIGGGAGALPSSGARRKN